MARCRDLELGRGFEGDGDAHGFALDHDPVIEAEEDAVDEDALVGRVHGGELLEKRRQAVLARRGSVRPSGVPGSARARSR